MLEPGESQKLTISFDGTALERFDQDESAWVVDQGDYGVLVGDSSRGSGCRCSASCGRRCGEDGCGSHFPTSRRN